MTNAATLGDILNAAANPDHKWKREVIDLLFNKNIIDAIKLMRGETGLGLKDSKDIVDQVNALINLKTQTVYQVTGERHLGQTFAVELDAYKWAFANNYSSNDVSIRAVKETVK